MNKNFTQQAQMISLLLDKGAKVIDNGGKNIKIDGRKYHRADLDRARRINYLLRQANRGGE